MRGIALILLAALLVSTQVWSQQLVMNNNKREALVAIAFTGTCSVFAAIPYKKLSPSVTDVELWQTCELKLPSFWSGPADYLSVGYLVRIDCGRKEFATIAHSHYSEKFWTGGIVTQGEIKEPMWRPLSTGFTELERQCFRDGDIRKSIRKFDGPESKRNL